MSPKIMVHASTNNGFPHAELMYAREKLKRGELAQQEYAELLKRKVANILKLQEESGIDVYTGGAYGWDDIFSPFFDAGLRGVERNGLIRFFDNNTYYRKPIVVGKLGRTAPLIKPMVERLLREVSDPKRFKAFLPGPYTFLALSENNFYSDNDSLLADIVEILGAELEAILSTGVGYVEVNDPSLGWVNQEKLNQLTPYYKRFVGDNAQRVWFTLPFREPNPKTLSMLYSLGDVVVSLDLSSTTLHGGANVNDAEGWVASATSTLKALSDVVRGVRVDLGLVDARNTLLEDLRQAQKIVEQALAFSPKELYVSNSASLDFLPESVAFEKVSLLGRLKRRVNNLE